MKYTFLIASIIFQFTSVIAQNNGRQLNLTVGETYSQVQISKMNTQMELRGEEMTTSMELNGITNFTVKSANDSSYILSARFGKLAMIIKTNGQGVALSSEEIADQANPGNVMLQLLTSFDFNLELTRQGKVIAMDNVADLLTIAVNKTDKIEEAIKTAYLEQMKGTFSSDAIKEGIELSTYIFPVNSDKNQNSWEVITQKTSGVGGTVTKKLEVVSENEKQLRLKYKGTLITDKNKKMEMPSATISYDVFGQTSGTILIDKKTGWIIEYTEDNKSSGTTYMTSAENGSIDIPIKIAITSTIKDK